MTNLKCHVFECMHNKSSKCSLDSIQVDGVDATYKEDTICESYKDNNSKNKTLYEFANLDESNTGKSNIFSNIRCNSINCFYNKNQKCDKNNVIIKGDYISTYCDSFYYE